MNPGSIPSKDILHQTVEFFWQTFPPFWQRIRSHLRQVAEEQFAVSVEQFHILRHIRNGVNSVSELANAKKISRPAISQGVDALVQKGLVARTPDVHDRRHIRLTLTDSGNALLDAVFKDTCEWMTEILSVLSEEELQILTRAMAFLTKTQTT